MDKKPLKQSLSDLFGYPCLYSIADLVRLTGQKEPYIRASLSDAQKTHQLKWVKCKDGVKRIGDDAARLTYDEYMRERVVGHSIGVK